jgi:hypothetical protein
MLAVILTMIHSAPTITASATGTPLRGLLADYRRLSLVEIGKTIKKTMKPFLQEVLLILRNG